MPSCTLFRIPAHFFNDRFVAKQGVGELFYECERHVWKMGQKRALPLGIVMDGGSDWFGLHRDFIEYVINSDDRLISGLLEFGIYSFSPLEVCVVINIYPFRAIHVYCPASQE